MSYENFIHYLLIGRGIFNFSSDKGFCSMKPKRNQPCPCGSKKKYKKCCGRATQKKFFKGYYSEGAITVWHLKMDGTPVKEVARILSENLEGGHVPIEQTRREVEALTRGIAKANNGEYLGVEYVAEGLVIDHLKDASDELLSGETKL